VSHLNDKQRFTIRIARLSGEDARHRVQRYLASIFPQRPPDEIARVLDRLPLRFAVTAFPDRALRLIEGLCARGAEASAEPDPGALLATEERPLSIALEPLPDSSERTQGAGESDQPQGPPAFFWNAWAQALFSPRAFFSSLREPGGTFQALLFTATLGLLAAVLSFPAATLRAMGAGTFGDEPLVDRYLHMIFVQPLATVIGALVSAVLLHFGLRVFAGPRAFETTLKVVAYTSAASVFAAIPRAGTSIAGFVGLVLTLVGLSSAQRVRPIQALGAVVFPALLVAGLLVLVIGSFVLGGLLILHQLTP
jgi:hypothetical protein